MSVFPGPVLFMYMMFYVYLPFAEQNNEVRKIQSISSHIFWIATFLFDALLHTLVSVLVTVVHWQLDFRYDLLKIVDYCNVYRYYKK